MARGVAAILWLLVLQCASAQDEVAQRLRVPPGSHLTFPAEALDRHAERTWLRRIAEEGNAGLLGCKRYCDRIAGVFERLEAAVARLVPPPRPAWQLAIGTNPREEAWSLSGGRLYVSEAFIDAYELTDAELALVLGHEMGHVLLQHENETLTIAAAFVPRGVSASVDSMYAALDFDLGLSLKLEPAWRAEELAADDAGMVIGAAAGFEPDAMLAFFEKLARADDEGGSVVSDHPSSAERLRRARSLRDLGLQRGDAHD